MVQVEKKIGFIHRSRIDIIADILHVSVGGSRKTHLMYRCNLSYRQIQAYLDLLIEKGLLRPVSETGSSKTKILETTAKGQAFLQAYQNIRALLTV